MPTKHYLLKDENGNVAFLCGAVSAICDYFNVKLLEKELPHFVVSDVFEIETLSTEAFEKSIKKRLSWYAMNTYVDIPENLLEEIKQLDLQCVKIGNNLKGAFQNLACEHVVADCDVSEDFQRLKDDIGYYFSKELGVYRFKYLTAINNSVFKEFYSNEIHGSVLIAYEDYLVLIMLCV